MLNKVLENMDSIKEEFFEYFNLRDNYEVSINFINKDTTVPPHSHKQSVFNYVFNGELSITLDDVEKSCCAGEWIDIPAKKIHSLKTRTDVVLLGAVDNSDLPH